MSPCSSDVQLTAAGHRIEMEQTIRCQPGRSYVCKCVAKRHCTADVATASAYQLWPPSALSDLAVAVYPLFVAEHVQCMVKLHLRW